MISASQKVILSLPVSWQSHKAVTESFDISMFHWFQLALGSLFSLTCSNPCTKRSGNALAVAIQADAARFRTICTHTRLVLHSR